MHCAPGMSNQWKWPIHNNELWYDKVVWIIAPPEPIHVGWLTSVAGLSDFDENI